MNCFIDTVQLLKPEKFDSALNAREDLDIKQNIIVFPHKAF